MLTFESVHPKCECTWKSVRDSNGSTCNKPARYLVKYFSGYKSYSCEEHLAVYKHVDANAIVECAYAKRRKSTDKK